MHGCRCLSLMVVKIGTEARQTAEPLSGQIRAMRIYISRSKMRKHCCQCRLAGFLRSPSMILKARASATLSPPTTSGNRALRVLGISEVQRRLCGELIEGC